MNDFLKYIVITAIILCILLAILILAGLTALILMIVR